ncbi:MAG: DUF1446 domain-containing protein [Acidimicrobiia bacterium]|nr:DUF1446 domain-containing protein [Acidimicrobiia bacterium]
MANCSGFYGDRLSAAHEMVNGGPIDVLTGDWLAELTMLILAKDRVRNPAGGYAGTFVQQMNDVLATCAERSIKVVSNAGGLNPAGCAAQVQEIADSHGLDLTVAWVEGDDLTDRLDQLVADGLELVNADTGESLADLGVEAIAANAYLGGWPIREALVAGADVVITGRVTDAALVVGPAAWHHGWARTDWDELAAAVVAGHVIECGTQCTGGNYAFFEEIPGLERPGFPIAEIHADGSSVITKHPGTGGAVTVGTVTAQLLYEVQGVDYLNPDATVRLNSIRLEPDGEDRVRIHSVRGMPGPEQVKVSVNSSGGWRNTMTFVLTGLDIEAKAALAERTLFDQFPEGRDSFEQVDVQLIRHDRPDPQTNAEALAELRVSVTDHDRARVGRAFSSKVVEMVLASYPGMFTTTPPGDARAFGIYWPVLVPADVPDCEVVVGNDRIAVPPPPTKPPALAQRTPRRVPTSETSSGRDVPKTAPATASTHPETISTLLEDLGRLRIAGGSGAAGDGLWWDQVAHRTAPLGLVAGARSGDKGGNANVGMWARTDDGFDWLSWYLTEDRFRALLGSEAQDLDITRVELPNLRALNFVVHGLLGRGVAASTRIDPQAKGLGEFLRARHVEVPIPLLDEPTP